MRAEPRGERREQHVCTDSGGPRRPWTRTESKPAPLPRVRHERGRNLPNPNKQEDDDQRTSVTATKKEPFSHIAGRQQHAPVEKTTLLLCEDELDQQEGVTGLENTLSTNGSVYNEKGAGRPNKYHFKYVINEREKCKGKSPFLILLIAAEPGQVEARQAIRQTWGNESLVPGLQMVRIFLLGVTMKLNHYLQRAIMEESRQHHDIVQQEYLDTYYNLTIKTLMGMNWVASYCPHIPYVMKTDSDMFVNTEYLIHKLLRPEQPHRHNYFTGYLMRGYAPNRNKDSKWYMPPDLYPSERYPVFCSGTGYVFSGDLADKIFKVSLSIRRLHLEDVYVGICLAKLRIDPVPPPNEFVFNHWRVSYSSCKYSHLITSHQFQPSELIKYWNHLQQNKLNACVTAAKEKAGRYRHRKLH
ncbi:hypothetical protein NDU88_006102 [Pleurodeles waltl]|uniref:Hexosyltransferase n=1 Tax=Pleurodeles waltl TaxID=8319 RepID=A0AAV7TCI5_PLEWA|nr:hypothetical protein NDU88_006102 [Pleurodeles waltl]